MGCAESTSTSEKQRKWMKAKRRADQKQQQKQQRMGDSFSIIAMKQEDSGREIGGSGRRRKQSSVTRPQNTPPQGGAGNKKMRRQRSSAVRASLIGGHPQPLAPKNPLVAPVSIDTISNPGSDSGLDLQDAPPSIVATLSSPRHHNRSSPQHSSSDSRALPGRTRSPPEDVEETAMDGDTGASRGGECQHFVEQEEPAVQRKLSSFGVMRSTGGVSQQVVQEPPQTHTPSATATAPTLAAPGGVSSRVSSTRSSLISFKPTPITTAPATTGGINNSNENKDTEPVVPIITGKKNRKKTSTGAAPVSLAQKAGGGTSPPLPSWRIETFATPSPPAIAPLDQSGSTRRSPPSFQIPPTSLSANKNNGKKKKGEANGGKRVAVASSALSSISSSNLFSEFSDSSLPSHGEAGDDENIGSVFDSNNLLGGSTSEILSDHDDTKTIVISTTPQDQGEVAQGGKDVGQEKEERTGGQLHQAQGKEDEGSSVDVPRVESSSCSSTTIESGWQRHPQHHQQTSSSTSFASSSIEDDIDQTYSAHTTAAAHATAAVAAAELTFSGPPHPSLPSQFDCPSIYALIETSTPQQRASWLQLARLMEPSSHLVVAKQRRILRLWFDKLGAPRCILSPDGGSPLGPLAVRRDVSSNSSSLVFLGGGGPKPPSFYGSVNSGNLSNSSPSPSATAAAAAAGGVNSPPSISDSSNPGATSNSNESSVSESTRSSTVLTARNLRQSEKLIRQVEARSKPQRDTAGLLLRRQKNSALLNEALLQQAENTEVMSSCGSSGGLGGSSHGFGSPLQLYSDLSPHDDTQSHSALGGGGGGGGDTDGGESVFSDLMELETQRLLLETKETQHK